MNVQEWIRCNKCRRLRKNSSKSFSVTQCQHIFCERCVSSEPLAKGTCPECKAVDVRTMTLEEPWEQTVLAPFCRSLPEMMNEAHQAADFQQTQASIALRRYDEIKFNYEKLKKNYFQTESYRKSLRQKNEKLDLICNELNRQWNDCQNCERATTNSSANRSTTNVSSLSIDRRKIKQEGQVLQSCSPITSDSICSFYKKNNTRTEDCAIRWAASPSVSMAVAAGHQRSSTRMSQQDFQTPSARSIACSLRTINQRQENSQYAAMMEQKAIPPEVRRPRIPAVEADQRSLSRVNRCLIRNGVSFTPHNYSPRVIFSDDASTTSGTNPNT